MAGREVEISRASLGLWLNLESLRHETKPESIREYLGYYDVDQSADGIDLLSAYVSLLVLNRLHVTLPIFTVRDESQKQKTVPWDYPERSSINWVHTLAYGYHWSRAEILQLDPDEAAAYYQELAVEKQLDAEWDHSLSQNAYSYDSATHESKFVPLKRPGWMQLEKVVNRPKPPRRIPANMLPMGPITDFSTGLVSNDASSSSES